MSSFKITKNKLLVALVITVVAVIFNKQILEGFRQGRRFFWAYTPSTRNMTYDIRHDRDVRTPYKPKETGVFYESIAYPNFADI